MLFLISPAKTLDYETPVPTEVAALATRPRFVKEAAALIEVLKTKSAQDIASLMDLSDPLAQLNVARRDLGRERELLGKGASTANNCRKGASSSALIATR